MEKLKLGDKAPAFNLVDQNGKSVSLDDFKGRKLLLYFYPKASTPGCTRQSCSVRDSLVEFYRLGAAAIGISPDPPERQKNFDEKQSLGFPLLSDGDHQIAEAYGVWGEKSMFGKKFHGIIRSSFLIDEEGTLIGAWYKVGPSDTVPLALKALKENDK